MSSTAQKWRGSTGDHVLFYGYRWLAWVVGGLVVAWPGRTSPDLPREAGLLLLSGILNVVATALTPSYLPIARRRPWLLGIDLLGGIIFVWVSASQALPFLPLALGSLIAPVVLFGWRGALIGAGVLLLLDQCGLYFFADDGQRVPSMLLVRGLVPFVFALGAVGANRILRQGRSPELLVEQPAGAGPLAGPQPPAQELASGHYEQLDEGNRGRGTQPPAFEPARATQMIVARTTAEQRVDAPRQAIYALTPGLDVSLPSALDQLADNFGRSAGLTVRMRLVGTACQLRLAQHSVLLRLAQEGLLNVQQHARARVALLTLHYEPRAVSLVIQDDGVGLLDGTHERPGVHALRAMHYRVAELDGRLEVFEGEAGGVTVRATLPLDEQAHDE